MTNMKELLQIREQPNTSVKIQPISNEIEHHFSCSCALCQNYQSQKVQKLLIQKTNTINKVISRKLNSCNTNFPYLQQIVKKLMIPRNKIIIQGLDIFIPEMCFFKDGQFTKLYVSKSISNACIKKISKQKITLSFLFKLFEDRRSAYREVIRCKNLSVLTPRTNKSDRKKQFSTVENVVIIKYLDGFQQPLSDYQFMNFTLRRKTDPIWKQIVSIRAKLGSNNELKQIIVIRYIEGQHKYPNLFQRAKILMKIYGQNIRIGDKQYISNEQENKFCKQILNESYFIYAQYNMYKIIHFIHYFHDERITKIYAKFLINDIEQIYLLDVYRLELKEQIKYIWTNQIYDKKVQKQYLNKKINISQQIKQRSKKITQQMQKQYNKLKNYYGFLEVQQDDKEQKNNDNFYSFLHPEIKINLSDILKTKSITIEKFKKVYLGQKNKKKSIIKEFNSNMIRTLHRTTPKLKILSCNNNTVQCINSEENNCKTSSNYSHLKTKDSRTATRHSNYRIHQNIFNQTIKQI